MITLAELVIFILFFIFFFVTLYTGEMLVNGHKRCQTFPRCLQTPLMTAFHWRTVFCRLILCSEGFSNGSSCGSHLFPSFSFFSPQYLCRLHCCNIRMCNLIFRALSSCPHFCLLWQGYVFWCFTHTYTCKKYCGCDASLKKRSYFVVGTFHLRWVVTRYVEAITDLFKLPSYLAWKFQRCT